MGPMNSSETLLESPLSVVLEQLRSGRPIIIRDSHEREDEADIAFAGLHATEELMNFCIKKGGGLVCAVISEDLAVKLRIPRLPTCGHDRFATPFGFPVNLANGLSGISAQDRADTVRSMANPAASAHDYIYPGHVPTLIAKKGGLKERLGHTEAIHDLLHIAGLDGPGVLCEILDEHGRIAREAHIQSLARTHELPIISIETIRKAGL